MKRNMPPYHILMRSRQRIGPVPVPIADGEPMVKADGRVYMPCSAPRPFRRRPGEIDHYVVTFFDDDTGTWSTLGQEDPEDNIGDVHWSVDISPGSDNMETAYVRVK